MPYIGRDLNRGNYLKLDDISSSFNGSTQTFNLTVGGSAFTPGSAFSILVSVGGVIQEPESAYQVNNSEITFANAPTAQDSFFCIALGVALGIGVPGNGTVNGTQMSKPFNYDGFFYLNDGTNRVGINSSIPSETLDIVGNTKISGIVTATSFSGPLSNASGISTFYDLRVTNNLTVEGTTTTLDTNLIGVDRIEVGANSNSVVGVAITQSGTADIVNLFDGGTNVLTVTDTGKVGLGTDNPDTLLHVYGSSATQKLITLAGGGSKRNNYIGIFQSDNLEIGADEDNQGGDSSIRFRIDGSEKVRITSTGQVGIATDTIPTQGKFFVGVQTSSNNYVSQPTVRFAVETSPDATLGDVSAVHIGQRAAGSADPAIIFHRRSGDVAWKSWGARIHQGGLDSLRFSFAPSALPGSHTFTDEMIIKRAVGVGIGTNNPTSKLHIRGDHANSVELRVENTEGFIRFRTNNNVGSYGAQQHIFKSSDLGTEYARFNASGNLGIGTDNPSQLLHLAADSEHQILLKRGGAAPSEVAFKNSGNYAVISNNTNGIDFQTGTTPSSSMHIDQNGKVGIGTDNPGQEISIWNDSPAIRLVDTNPYAAGQYGQIAQSGGVLQLTAKGDGATHGSIYFYGQNNSELVNLYRTSDNTHQWYTASDSNSMKMRLIDSGNLGIGTINPGKKLEIHTTGTSGDGILLKATDNTYPSFIGDSNRSNNDLFLVALQGYWNGNRVGEVTVESGSDTTNKDEGMVRIRTRNAGDSSPQDRFTVYHTGQTQVHSTTDSSSTTTGSLIVSGGVGIAKTITCGGNIIVSDNQKLYFEGDDDDDFNCIGRQTSENSIVLTSRHDLANIIDSNNDDTDSHWTVRHNGTTIAGSSELFRVQSDGKITNNPSYLTHNVNLYGGNSHTAGVRIEVAHSTTTVSGNTASGSFPHHLNLTNYSGNGSADNRMVTIGFDIPTTSTHANGAIAYQATGAGQGDFSFWTETGNAIYERLRITSDGKVGISTASPTAKLTIGRATGGYMNEGGIQVNRPHSLGLKNGIHVYTDAGYNNTASYQNSAFKATGTSGHAFACSTDAGSNGQGGTLNAKIDFDGDAHFLGDLGVGTNSPVARLHIHNSGTTSSDHAYAFFTTGDTGSTASDGLTVGVAANQVATVNYREAGTLSLGTAGTPRFQMTGTGGITATLGSNNSDNFQIDGHASQGRTTFAVKAGNDTSNSITSMRLVRSNGNNPVSIFIDNSSNDGNWMNSIDGGDIIFHLMKSGSGSSLPKFRVNHDGKVSLGDSPAANPSATLHVRNSGNVSSTLGGAPASVMIEATTNQNWSGGDAGAELLFKKGGDITGAIRNEHDRTPGSHSYEDAGLAFYTAPAAESPTATKKFVIKSTGDIDIVNGNLSFANGRGISFASTDDGSGTMSSEKFEDYEEGTFTPTSNATLSTAEGSYTKIGRQVTVHIRVTFSSQSSGTQVNIGGLPYSGGMPGAVSNGSVPNGFGYISGGSVIPQVHMTHNTAVLYFYNFGSIMTISNVSGKQYRFGLVYHT